MKHQNAHYAAMVYSLDENVGRVLRHLDERGLSDNTIVIFMSDNGGYLGVDRKSGQTVPATNNAPLRSGKGSLYEGGIRVPLIVRWPELTPAGAVCDEPVICEDLLPTVAEAVGAQVVPGTAGRSIVDGVSLTPLLEDPESQLGRDALYFHYPHYYSTTSPVSAIRSGDWKLLEYFEDDHLELFDLATDPAEQVDLAEKMTERARTLRDRLASWRERVDAKLPVPNPGYNPDR
jgi:uncharacterized sulfatase